MRVIAGELKGQQLVAPRGWKVRPTSERVREAVFSTLGSAGRGRRRPRPLLRHRGAGDRGALPRRRPRDAGRPRHAPGARQRRAARAARPRRPRPRRRRGAGSAAARPPGGGRLRPRLRRAPYKLADLVARQLDTHLPGVLAPGGRAVVESGARRPLAIGSLERLRQRRYGAADISIYALEDE